MAHKVLLKGVRGKHKIPGQFRTSSDATFIPPPHKDVPRLMGDLSLHSCHCGGIS